MPLRVKTTSATVINTLYLPLFLLLLLDPITTFSTAAAPAAAWEQWSCNDLTPNLCNLTVQSGNITIQSIPVHYWRYSKSKTDQDEDYGESSTLSKSYNDTTIAHSIIALHGGPSWPHSYMLPLKQLACRGDTAEVIFYDQAGCGKSILPHSRHTANNNDTNDESTITVKERYPHLLDPNYYSNVELPTLIQHWGLDRYHVLGHSWGTILAQLFALNNQHNNNISVMEGLQSLILSGPISDAKAYIAAQWDPNDTNNLASLPPFVQRRIHALEDVQGYETDEYQAIDSVLSTFFTMRTAPPPDCFDESAKGLNEEIYVGMQGASEFTISGVLGDLNLTSRLHELTIPVLLTHGKFDTMRPSTVKAIQNQIPRSERVMFPHSGHVSMIDDAGLMNDVVASFVHRVEGGFEIGGGDVVTTKAGDDGIVVESDVVESISVRSWTWIQVVVAFLSGLIMGELKIFRRRNGNGYTSV